MRHVVSSVSGLRNAGIVLSAISLISSKIARIASHAPHSQENSTISTINQQHKKNMRKPCSSSSPVRQYGIRQRKHLQKSDLKVSDPEAIRSMSRIAQGTISRTAEIASIVSIWLTVKIYGMSRAVLIQKILPGLTRLLLEIHTMHSAVS